MKRTEKCISFVATQILTLTVEMVKQRHTFTEIKVASDGLYNVFMPQE